MREAMRAVGAMCAAYVLAATTAWAGPGGTLAGTVTVEGPRPERPPLPVFKNEDVCGKGVADDRLVVGSHGGVRYAVVSVEGVQRGRKPERDVTLVLDNRG